MQWDIHTLSLEKQWVLKWDFSPLKLNIATNGGYSNYTLFSIWKYKSIYVYSMETQLIVASCSIDGDVKECLFLTSDIGERLLVICHKEWKTHFYLLDPYTLKNPVDARKLIISESCTDPSEELDWPYIINDNRYFYIREGQLSIRKLVGGNWIEYLWNNLEDPNKVSVHSLEKKHEKLIHNLLLVLDDGNPQFISQSDTYRGTSCQWDVEFAADRIILSAAKYINQEWIRIEESRNAYLIKPECVNICETSKYVIKIKIIEEKESDDLLIITCSGIFIWTINSEEEIQLRYFWKPTHKDEEESIFRFELTPDPFVIVTEKYDHKVQGDLELSEDFKDPFKTSLHGKAIMKELLNSNKTELIEKLLDSLVQSTIVNGEISNIQLLNIVAENFVELSQNYPYVTNKFLAQVAFFIPGDSPLSEIVEHNSISKHRQHFGEYISLYSFNSLNRFIFFLRKKLISEFLRKFRRKSSQVEDKKSTIKLVFPLPGFTCYPSKYVTLKELIVPQSNGFTEYDNLDLYKWWNGEALLDFKAISFLGIGVYFSMMIGVARQAFSFILILGFIVLAFAHSLHLLLRPTLDYSLTTSINSNDPNNPWNLATRFYAVSSNGTIDESNFIIDPPDSGTNMFSTLYTSILAVYLMLTGDSSPISSWTLTENFTLIILLVIFSFFTTIYLINLFIGLLGNAIGATSTNESFLYLKAEILAEIELFYMLPYQRRKPNWFPEFLQVFSKLYCIINTEIVFPKHNYRRFSFYVVDTIKVKDLIFSIQNNEYHDSNLPYISQKLLKLVQIKDEQAEKEKKTEELEKERHQEIARLNQKLDEISKSEKSIHQEIKEIKKNEEEIRNLIMQLSQEIRSGRET
ncbi:16685_t:CDS:2, partial [Acaulospora colombiana]